MSAKEKSMQMIAEEWLSFVENGEIHIEGVRKEIIDSWFRCKFSAVEHEGLYQHPKLNAFELNASKENHADLLKVANPFMANVYKFIKGTGFVVVLTDESGHILELFADNDVHTNDLTRNFILGSSWKEIDAGTNAIGTSIIMKEAIQISGAEHYRKQHHNLTCSAAPIFDVAGKLIGIINISGPCESSHVHTLGMVVEAADAIMAQFRIENKNKLLALANRKLVKFFNMVSDGVLMIDAANIITGMNPAAETILGYEKTNCIGESIFSFINTRFTKRETQFSFGESFSFKECIVQSHNGPLECIISSEPFYDFSDRVDGCFVTLKPIKQVQKLLNRYSGYMASLEFNDIVGNSSAMKEVIHLAKVSANNDSNILLTGESGTGKEIIAQAIHNLSPQASAPFVPLNCAAIPRELIGSELFGYEEGAFTGAKRGGKPGKFELASGGTLFLDEIGDMPLEHQTVLLRAIQEKKIVRIGGDKLLPVDVRLICATNKDLMAEVDRGTFRRDLYYRLNVMSILMPPLRERKDDITLLFDHFLSKMCANRSQTISVDPQVYDAIRIYSWPGNVRELQNVVERAINLSENGRINLLNLPEYIMVNTEHAINSSSNDHKNLKMCREESRRESKEIEKKRIINLLNLYAGNVSKVANEMDISRKTLYNKMKEYTIYK